METRNLCGITPNLRLKNATSKTPHSTGQSLTPKNSSMAFADFWDIVHRSEGNPKKAFGPASLAAYLQTHQEQMISTPDGTKIIFC